MKMKLLIVSFVCYLSGRASAGFSGDPGPTQFIDGSGDTTTAPTEQCFEEGCLDKVLLEYEEVTLTFITKYKKCIKGKNDRFLANNNGDCPPVRKVKKFEEICYNKSVGIQPNGTITLGNIRKGILKVIRAGGECPGANALLWLQQVKVDMKNWLAEFTDCLYEKLTSGLVACVQPSKLPRKITGCFRQAQSIHNQAVVSDIDYFTGAFEEFFMWKINEQCSNPHTTPLPDRDTTSVEIETTPAGVESTTAGVESTTAGVESTTAGVESTTAGVESTTGGVESTTAGVESTTAGVETTTAGIESTTAGVESTTAGEETTTTGPKVVCTLSCTDGADVTSPGVDTTSAGVDTTSARVDVTQTTEQQSCYPDQCFVDLKSDLMTATKRFIRIYRNCMEDKISNFKSSNNNTCPLKKKVKNFEEKCYNKAYLKEQNATIILGRIRSEILDVINDPSDCPGDNATRWLNEILSEIDPWMTLFFNCMEGELVSGSEMCFGMSKLTNATHTCHKQAQDADHKKYVTTRANFIDPFMEYFQTFLEGNCLTSTTPATP